MLSICAVRHGEAPFYAINADATHDAASTVKTAVLAALYRSGTDLDVAVPVHDRFASQVPGRSFHLRADEDSDPIPWRRIGGRATVRWLAERMITHSSNLAAGLCVERIGLEPVARVLQDMGISGTRMARLPGDDPAREAGAANQVTAAGFARLLLALRPDELNLLERNTFRDDLPIGLPAGARVAVKNSWGHHLRHSGALVFPPDAPPYALAVCYTGPLANGRAVGDPAARLLARVSAQVWSRRRY
ncbi:class A beta-lactamase-related serine hydrolase [Nocardia wallacei]|uniref:class A beta-lactamase-related serine hydrolase n=1 Tax=Nocardia wallacei TaxID=480035 RepID=UPI002454FFE9|nr:class A beta-lactamase-related serine hydrolase [Nocardia wallacei]